MTYTQAEVDVLLQERHDWSRRGDTTVEDAVDRVRDGSTCSPRYVEVATDDLRKLFVSADGLAWDYCVLTDHVTHGKMSKIYAASDVILEADDETTADYHRWFTDEVEPSVSALEGNVLYMLEAPANIPEAIKEVQRIIAQLKEKAS